MATLRLLRVAVAPVWSPDGEWIAFVANGEEAGLLNIFVVRPDGSDLRQLSDRRDFNVEPAWSPTSQQIVYRSGADQVGDIFVVNIDGTGRANLTSNDVAQREPHWSPDGARIAFSHASGEVTTGQGLTALTDTIAFYRATLQGGSNLLQTTVIQGSTPTWSPVGHYLAFRRPASEPGPIDTTIETLHVLQADGLETGRIPGIEGAMLIYDWSPDAEALAVAVTDLDDNGARNLWRAQLDGSAPVLLAEQLETWARLAWRPDPSRTPEPSKTSPVFGLPTSTPDTRESSEPGTQNSLDSKGLSRPVAWRFRRAPDRVPGRPTRGRDVRIRLPGGR